MASEITVTFSDGGIYNGSANSYTKGGITTYYFEFDKKYRVQLGALNAITLQQYKNTNGAWYDINIISSVNVQSISVDLSDYYTKSQADNKFLDKNALDDYYTKKQCDARFLQSVSFDNYYTKADCDGRFVNKSGDTMTGTLYFSTDNSRSYINGSTLNFYKGNDTSTILLQLYNGTIFMNGRLYLADNIPAGQTPENYFQLSINGMYRNNNYTQPFNFNCPVALRGRVDLFSTLYVRSNDDSVAYIWNNNGHLTAYKNHAFTINDAEFNSSGNSIQFVNDGFYASPLHFYSTTILNANLIANAQITSYSSISVDPSSGSGANTVINAGTITTYTSLNNNNAQRSIITGAGIYNRMDYSSTYVWLRYNYQRYVVSGVTTMEIANGGIDIYNGAYITYHSGRAGVTEQYTRMNNAGLTMYNANYNNGFTINTGTGRFEITGAETITMNASNLIHATAGTTLTLTDSGGAIVVKNIIQALNNAFYGEEFLNALNKVFLFIFNKIGGSVYYEFPSQNYGGGFSAGGGSSRGGGVGRRK